MYIKQSDLFRGVRMDFLRKVMEITHQESHPEGTLLFHADDPATHFYILINGRVQLSLGETGKRIHIGSQRGESFGWACLVGKDLFTASAQCLEHTDLLKINAQAFKALLSKYLDDGFVFYKNLSEALAGRLIQSYLQMTAPDD
jgi:CRP-like cAMP-binding protein